MIPKAVFATSDAAEQLITRPKILQDNPTPSDNALALEALQLHAALTGDLSAIREMEATMASVSLIARRHPPFAGHSLAVWATHLAGIREVAITGSEAGTADMERIIWSAFRPDAVVAVNRDTGSSVPLLAGRDATDQATAYVCSGLVCDLPVTTAEALADRIGR
ncbi:MAG: hypothetical protein R2823_01885 [Acidimicrobiia bacterium]